MESTTAVSSGGTILDRFAAIEASWGRTKTVIVTVGLTLVLGVCTAFYWLTKTLADAQVVMKDAKEQQKAIEQTVKDSRDLQQGVRNILTSLDSRVGNLEKAKPPQTVQPPSAPGGAVTTTNQTTQGTAISNKLSRSTSPQHGKP